MVFLRNVKRARQRICLRIEALDLRKCSTPWQWQRHSQVRRMTSHARSFSKVTDKPWYGYCYYSSSTHEKVEAQRNWPTWSEADSRRLRISISGYGQAPQTCSPWGWAAIPVCPGNLRTGLRYQQASTAQGPVYEMVQCSVCTLPRDPPEYSIISVRLLPKTMSMSMLYR